MGFATQLLSLSRLSLLPLPAANCDERSGFNAYPNVFTMRKSRNRRRPAQTSQNSAQLTLPLQIESADSRPRTLKIVQREPHEQPERLLISGRMADVCAELERMALSEPALQA